MNQVDPETGEKARSITILGRTFVMPRSRFVRIVIGCLLIAGGILGFLPVLGFWMVPLGLVVLSYEFATVRRWRRRMEVWWAERRGRRRRAQAAEPTHPATRIDGPATRRDGVNEGEGDDSGGDGARRSS